MSYPDGMHEVNMAPAGIPTSVAGVAERGAVNLGVTGVQATWTPGLVPHIIHGVSVTPFVTTALANAGIFSLRMDGDTKGTPTQIVQITLPTTIVANSNVHKSFVWMATYKVQVNPGTIVDFNVTAAGSGYGIVKLMVEPVWETPTNLSRVVQL